MPTEVPAQYVSGIRLAARDAGVPYDVAAAQLALESVNFDPYYVLGPGESPTGAQGIAQFEPGTWSAYGHGSPYNVTDALRAYSAYMRVLLRQEHGSVRNALAAYNAGPGNLAAGYGYADRILAAAKEPVGITEQGGPGGGSFFGSGIFSLPSQVTGFFKALDDLVNAFMWLADPGHWVRIIAGVLGVIFLGAGLIVMGKAA